jgi:hypothetical protein
MLKIEFFIVPEGPTWKVRFHDQDSTPYETLQEAIEAAIEEARGCRKLGLSAEVFVPQAQGCWRSLHT